MNAPYPADSRFVELDVFRGLAAASVVLFHFISRYPQMIAGTGDPGRLISFLTPPVRLIGAIPVLGFFMISEFVIVWTLERCRNWQDFAVSRFSRLYPTFWAAATATYVVGVIDPLPFQDYTPAQFLANLTMFEEMAGVPALDGSYWSLTVELLFYLGMGALFALGWLRHLHVVCLIWVTACLAHAGLALAGIDVWWRVQKYGLLNFGPFLIAGAMFFQLWKNRRQGWSVVILCGCLGAVWMREPRVDAVVCSLFFALFLLAVRGHLRRFVTRPLPWLGSVSYALYVVHEFLGYRILLWLEQAGLARPAAIAVALAAVLLLAWVITTVVERPALRLIRAAWHGRAAVPAG